VDSPEKIVEYWSITDKHILILKIAGDCRGRDRMVVGFITTYAISAYHH
jgi:hypothetical protein